jgi:hypothetical protein
MPLIRGKKLNLTEQLPPLLRNAIAPLRAVLNVTHNLCRRADAALGYAHFVAQGDDWGSTPALPIPLPRCGSMLGSRLVAGRSDRRSLRDIGSNG